MPFGEDRGVGSHQSSAACYDPEVVFGQTALLAKSAIALRAGIKMNVASVDCSGTAHHGVNRGPQLVKVRKIALAAKRIHRPV